MEPGANPHATLRREQQQPHRQRRQPQRVNAKTQRVFQLPDVQDKQKTLGLEPWISSPEGAVKFQAAEIVKWAKVVKDSGARAE